MGPLLHTWCLLPGSVGGTRIVFAMVSNLLIPILWHNSRTLKEEHNPWTASFQLFRPSWKSYSRCIEPTNFTRTDQQCWSHGFTRSGPSVWPWILPEIPLEILVIRSPSGSGRESYCSWAHLGFCLGDHPTNSLHPLLHSPGSFHTSIAALNDTIVWYSFVRVVKAWFQLPCLWTPFLFFYLSASPSLLCGTQERRRRR